jgi:hypothetical protein
MRLPRLWRRWVIVIATVLILGVAAVRSLDSPSWIYYYRVIDERTLIVGTVTGPGAWTRVTSVTETPSTLTITVSSLLVQLGPGAAVGVAVETTANLRDPIAGRTVIDGSSGLPVQRTDCLPPTYLAPGCTPWSRGRQAAPFKSRRTQLARRRAGVRTR